MTPSMVRKTFDLILKGRLLSIVLTVVALIGLSFESLASNEEAPINHSHVVKIKLLADGNGWIRFVELDSKSGQAVGMATLACDDYNAILYSRIVNRDQTIPRRLTFLSGYKISNEIECAPVMKTITGELSGHLGEISWSKEGIPTLSFLPEAIDPDTQKVRELMKGLNRSYRAPRIQQLPSLFYTGAKTKYAYIYIHGLFMNKTQFSYNASTNFLEGSNSIVTVLPGHESNAAKTFNLYSENDWINHAHQLVEIAKSMGDKVIVVGHSTGGLLGFILGLEKKIDGAILIQPAFGLTVKSRVGSLLGGVAKLLTNKFQEISPKPGRMVSRLISKTFHCPEQKPGDPCNFPLDYPIPTIIYTDPKDDVVDSAVTEKIVKLIGSPDVQLFHHKEGHMHIPDLRDIRL